MDTPAQSIPPTVPNLVVTYAGSQRQAARSLAEALGLSYVETPTPMDAPLAVVKTDTHLELLDTSTAARVKVEFTFAELQRYRAGGAGPNPFRRAIGPAPRTLVDATAGLGRDAVHLAMLGYAVTAIERHPIVSLLAEDGIARARRDGLLLNDNPAWLLADARAALPNMHPRPATVYLDPMFPPKRKKSAAVRKEMELVRRLVLDDGDAIELLEVARACAADRVVVKRPDEAPPLIPSPTASYRGKLVRYDVYRTMSR